MGLQRHGHLERPGIHLCNAIAFVIAKALRTKAVTENRIIDDLRMTAKIARLMPSDAGTQGQVARALVRMAANAVSSTIANPTKPQSTQEPQQQPKMIRAASGLAHGSSYPHRVSRRYGKAKKIIVALYADQEGMQLLSQQPVSDCEVRDVEACGGKATSRRGRGRNRNLPYAEASAALTSKRKSTGTKAAPLGTLRRAPSRSALKRGVSISVRDPVRKRGISRSTPMGSARKRGVSNSAPKEPPKCLKRAVVLTEAHLLEHVLHSRNDPLALRAAALDRSIRPVREKNVGLRPAARRRSPILLLNDTSSSSSDEASSSDNETSDSSEESSSVANNSQAISESESE